MQFNRDLNCTKGTEVARIDQKSTALWFSMTVKWRARGGSMGLSGRGDSVESSGGGDIVVGGRSFENFPIEVQCQMSYGNLGECDVALRHQ